MMSIQECIQILEIDDIDSLDLNVLKRHYRRLAARYHPDKVQQKEKKKKNEEKFKKINEAYHILKEYLSRSETVYNTYTYNVTVPITINVTLKQQYYNEEIEVEYFSYEKVDSFSDGDDIISYPGFILKRSNVKAKLDISRLPETVILDKEKFVNKSFRNNVQLIVTTYCIMRYQQHDNLYKYRRIGDDLIVELDVSMLDVLRLNNNESIKFKIFDETDVEFNIDDIHQFSNKVILKDRGFNNPMYNRKGNLVIILNINPRMNKEDKEKYIKILKGGTIE